MAPGTRAAEDAQVQGGATHPQEILRSLRPLVSLYEAGEAAWLESRHWAFSYGWLAEGAGCGAIS